MNGVQAAFEQKVSEAGWAEQCSSFQLWKVKVVCPYNFRGRRVKLFVCLTHLALRHEDVWRNGCIDPHILDLGTSWRWVGPGIGLVDVERRNLAPTGTRTQTHRPFSPYRLRYPGSPSEVWECVKINVPLGELRDISQLTRRMRQ
jgi:hypothetical protein